MKKLFELGEQPEIGQVPEQMYAQVIRPERFGEPSKAFDVEVVDTPGELAPDEVLVYVMAAGVNYNNVWAGLGTPIDVTTKPPQGPMVPRRQRLPHRRQRCIRHRLGRWARRSTHLSPGDHVVIHCGQWQSSRTPRWRAARIRCTAPSFRIWGYETSWGSFAQFTRVQAHQCLPKPPQMSWEEASAYMLVGATAYRMLHGLGAQRG